MQQLTHDAISIKQMEFGNPRNKMVYVGLNSHVIVNNNHIRTCFCSRGLEMARNGLSSLKNKQFMELNRKKKAPGNYKESLHTVIRQ